MNSLGHQNLYQPLTPGYMLLTIPGFGVAFIGENTAAITALFANGFKFDIIQKDKEKSDPPMTTTTTPILALNQHPLRII